jgi:protein MpaA
MAKLAAAVAASVLGATAVTGARLEREGAGRSTEPVRQAAKRSADRLPSTQRQPEVALGSLRGFRRQTISVGRSTLGRPLEVVAFGESDAPRKVLVVGCIHGTECAGTAVVRRLPAGCPPRGVDLWLLQNLNPDGFARETRLNARGVDLNRNFPSGWQPIGRRWGPQYSGSRPLSEPETRAARRLIRLVRPEITIWFHQQSQPLVRAWGGSVPEGRRFARMAGLPFHRLPWLAGTAPNWQNHRFPGTSSFVVELPPGPASPRDSVRYAAAIEHLAGYVGENRAALASGRS